jgi:signal transduction histidine kinase
VKIRTKLTLLFILILVFAFAIYISHAENREDEFFKRLKQQAITKANLLLDANVDPEILQIIYKNTRNSLYLEEVAIFDTDFNLLYHDAVDIDFVKETENMIQEIKAKGDISFIQDGWQVVGFLFPYQGVNYIITAAAYDEYGYSKLQNLRYTLLIAFLFAIVVIYLLGLFYSKQVLKPIASVVNRVEEITATNLDLRVDEGKNKDEIGELAFTFNKMLDRLEKSFDAQKQFVSTISHELRTPLSAIIGEIEIAKSKSRNLEEYQIILGNVCLTWQKQVMMNLKLSSKT